MVIENLGKSFNNRTILSNVCVSLNKCGLVFIMGPSGVGKSTLLYMMGQLETHDEGHILFEDEPIKNSDVSYIFQNYNLLEERTVKENIKLAADIAGIELPAEEYKNILTTIGLGDVENQMVNTLSGGEKQRVALARALVRDTPIILADEPTGNLDVENTEICINLLKEISKRKLVIVVSHDVDIASKYADAIYYIENNTLVERQENGYKDNNKITSEAQPKVLIPWIKTYISSHIRLKKEKMSTMFWVVLFSILLVLGVLGIYSSFNNMTSEINRDILENDYFSIWNLSIENFGFEEIRQECIDKVKEDKNNVKVVEYGNLGFCTDQFEESISTIMIYNDDFFRKRFSNIIGKFPEKDDEIVINSQLAKLYFQTEKYEKIVGETMEFKLCHVHSEEMEIPTVKFKVSGIRTNDEYREGAIKLYLPSDKYINLMNEYGIDKKTTFVDVYVDSIGNNDLENMRDVVNSFGYTLEEKGVVAAKRIGSIMILWIVVILVIALLFIFFSCFVLYFWTKDYISGRTYETGVLKCLGVDDKSLFNILYGDILFASSLSFFTAVLLYIIAIIVQNVLNLNIYGIPVIIIEFWHILIAMVLGFAIPFISSYKSIKNLSERKLVDLLRNR